MSHPLARRATTLLIRPSPRVQLNAEAGNDLQCGERIDKCSIHPKTGRRGDAPVQRQGRVTGDRAAKCVDDS